MGTWLHRARGCLGEIRGKTGSLDLKGKWKMWFSLTAMVDPVIFVFREVGTETWST